MHKIDAPLPSVSHPWINQRLSNWLPSITLVVLALAAGLGWRAELELRSGWAGLAWLDYFHWAVPTFVAAFVAWAAVFAPVRRRTAFVATLAVLAITTYVATDSTMRLFFMAGPSAMVTVLNLGGGNFRLGLHRFLILRWSVVAFWPLIPISFCLVCRLFAAPVTKCRAVCAAALFAASWPAAIIFRMMFDHRGESDLIHALKSGFVIPVLIISLGVPLLDLRSLIGLAYKSRRPNAIKPAATGPSAP